MNISALLPLPVAVPLGVAAALLALSTKLPRRVPDALAIATAAAVTALCAALTVGTRGGPVDYWFGGWSRIGSQVVGIRFMAESGSAGVATTVGLLFTATLVFAWGFFEKVHAHFQVLMLVFMAGMVGFCLSGDLFNMFVWFELMSVAGFAATAYALRPAAIAGALNFTVVNTVGAYVFLAGLALLYGQIGALDLQALGEGVAADPGNPVIVLGFVLLATALLIKAAQVPFQMWLGDAHAVAPSPVSVIFSGAMVGMGLFGVAKITLRVFPGAPAVFGGVRDVLLLLGMASAAVGALMALSQRHIKRLLAFSTISHAGIMLGGLSLLSQGGIAGFLTYLVGHGLVKGAMFMLAGFVAAKIGAIDEIALRGAGRRYWPVGVLMAIGGLLLAGLPVGLMSEGHDLMHDAAEAAGRGWVPPFVAVCAAMTGAAVLRVAGRVFVGWGERPGDERDGETEDEREPGEQPVWLLTAPAVLLVGLGAVPWDRAGQFAGAAAAALSLRPMTAMPVSEGAGLAWFGVLLAVVIAAYELGRMALPGRLVGGIEAVRAVPLWALRRMQSGLVTDYVAWLAVGLAGLAAAFVFRA